MKRREGEREKGIYSILSPPTSFILANSPSQILGINPLVAGSSDPVPIIV